MSSHQATLEGARLGGGDAGVFEDDIWIHWTRAGIANRLQREYHLKAELCGDDQCEDLPLYRGHQTADRTPNSFRVAMDSLRNAHFNIRARIPRAVLNGVAQRYPNLRRVKISVPSYTIDDPHTVAQVNLTDFTMGNGYGQHSLTGRRFAATMTLSREPPTLPAPTASPRGAEVLRYTEGWGGLRSITFEWIDTRRQRSDATSGLEYTYLSPWLVPVCPGESPSYADAKRIPLRSGRQLSYVADNRTEWRACAHLDCPVEDWFTIDRAGLDHAVYRMDSAHRDPACHYYINWYHFRYEGAMSAHSAMGAAQFDAATIASGAIRETSRTLGGYADNLSDVRSAHVRVIGTDYDPPAAANGRFSAPTLTGIPDQTEFELEFRSLFYAPQGTARFFDGMVYLCYQVGNDSERCEHVGNTDAYRSTAATPRMHYPHRDANVQLYRFSGSEVNVAAWRLARAGFGRDPSRYFFQVKSSTYRRMGPLTYWDNDEDGDTREDLGSHRVMLSDLEPGQEFFMLEPPGGRFNASTTFILDWNAP